MGRCGGEKSVRILACPASVRVCEPCSRVIPRRRMRSRSWACLRCCPAACDKGFAIQRVSVRALLPHTLRAPTTGRDTCASGCMDESGETRREQANTRRREPIGRARMGGGVGLGATRAPPRIGS